MAETAAHQVDCVIPRAPVRQWVLSFPIPLRVLFASHPHLLAPVLQIVHRVISTFLILQTGLKRTQARTGAVTLIQRFGSAANLNIHLHCLVLDGVYRGTEGVPVFHAVRAPTGGELQALLSRIIRRLMKLLTRKGYLIEEQGMAYLADTDPDLALGCRGWIPLPSGSSPQADNPPWSCTPLRRHNATDSGPISQRGHR